MKKGLLFALALGLGSFAFGQNMAERVSSNTDVRQPSNDVMIEKLSNVDAPVQTNKSSKGALTGITIGYSANVYTMLVETQSCLTYNEDLNLLQFTHRAKVGETVTGGTTTSSGDIITSYSTDGGSTWNGILSYANGSAGNNRYPGGVIYNPTGNTNPMNAFTAYVGPVTDGSGWSSTFMGSRKFDNTMESNSYLSSNGELMRNGFTSNSSDKIRVITSTTIETPYAHDSTYLLTGTFNTTNNDFDWNMESFHYDFVVGADGGVEAYAWYFNTAWSQDGNTGYMWTIGRHQSNDVQTIQPIVWKTTDAGGNWALMPVTDMGTIPSLINYLRPLNDVTPTAVRPIFSNKCDGVVDANDQLHIMAYVQSSASDSTYFYNSQDDLSNPVIDFYTTPSGWDAIRLGSVYTDEIDKAVGGFGTGDDAIGWDMRLQAGKTLDGTKVFASWTDTDTNIAPTDDDGFRINLFPDIFVAGYDIVTGLQTNDVNFSLETSYYADFFFHYMSDIIISDNGTYIIPITKVEKGSDPADPVTHIYVQGIQFTDADFVTNPGFTQSIDNNISISQNRPNPFTNNTAIDVNLNKASNVSMKVINITGQTVYSVELGQKSQGTHTIDFDASNMASGIYFYTVTAGTSSVTKKMIIK